MNYIIDIFLIAMGAALINNFMLYYFVGMLPLRRGFPQIDMAFGMGCRRYLRYQHRRLSSAGSLPPLC